MRRIVSKRKSATGSSSNSCSPVKWKSKPNPVETINEKPWLKDDISPCHLYLKFLYEYFRKGTGKYDFIFLGKAYRFRNEVTRGYEKLHQNCLGRRWFSFRPRRSTTPWKISAVISSFFNSKGRAPFPTSHLQFYYPCMDVCSLCNYTINTICIPSNAHQGVP